MAEIVLRRDLSRLLTKAEGDANIENLNDELARAEADFYGDVDPTTLDGVNVGPGFKWAHESAGQLKIRNPENDGWFDLYELFSKIYTRDSVVGTVSQASGIPTGALIQRINNSNGEAWRHVGALQLCRVSTTLSSPAGSPHLKNATGSFPAAFSSAPTILFSYGAIQSPLRNEVTESAAASSSTYSIGLAANNGADLSSAGDVAASIFAIGRWYESA